MDDVEAIKQVKARYFRFLDTKDWDALVTVFSDDLVADTSGAGGPVVEGAGEFVGFLRKVLGDDVVTVHYGHMPEIEVTSPTTATGIWSLEDYVWRPGSALHGFGHYHETYERSDAGWQIKTLTITRLHTTVDP